MMLGRVTGMLHATLKNPRLEGHRLLVVRPVDRAGLPSGPPLVCIDRVDAGVADTVLVCREGGAARILTGDAAIPVQAMVVAIVDRTDWAGGEPPR